MGRFRQARDRTRQITAIYIAGDMPNLSSLLLPGSRSALVAITPVTFIWLSHDRLKVQISRQPRLAEALWRDCMVDAAIAAEWMFNLGRHDAHARIAHLFCEMAARYQSIGRYDDDKFRVPMNQYYLGEAMGLTAIHVKRTLRTCGKIC